jgi:uncharacterized membrane protein YbhN (UPF0104 family)
MKKHHLLLLIKIAVAALFFAVLFLNKNITLAHFHAIWGNASPLFLCLSLVLAAACWVLNAVRWHYFLRAGEIPSAPRRSALSYFAGVLLGSTTPGRLGEFGRGIYHEGLPLKETALVSLADKAYFLVFILGFGLLGLALGGRAVSAISPIPLPVLLGLTAAALLVAGYAVMKGRKIPFRGLFARFPADPADRFFLLTLSNIIYVLTVFQLYCILLALGDARLTHAFVTLSVTLLLLSVFPVSLGNLGVRETCFVVLLGKLGNTSETAALSAGLLVFVQNLLFPSLIGVAANFFGPGPTKTRL